MNFFPSINNWQSVRFHLADSVHRRNRNRITDVGWNGFDVFPAKFLESIQVGEQPGLTVFEDIRLGRILQIFYKGVDFRCLIPAKS